MALHPHVVTNAQKGDIVGVLVAMSKFWVYIELDSVVGRERLPSWNDEENLPYIRATIKEIHRWSPIGSLGKLLPTGNLEGSLLFQGVPHRITEDITFNNQFIPKGTIVMPSLVTLNRDPERYSDPDIFDPTRFLSDPSDAYTSALSADHMLRDHFHYGFGRRLCQGIHLAEDSLFIVVSRILWALTSKNLMRPR